jgi:hypothetical protein
MPATRRFVGATSSVAAGGSVAFAQQQASGKPKKLTLDFDNFGRMGDVIQFAYLTLECDEHADLDRYRVLEYAERGSGGGGGGEKSDDWLNLLSIHIATDMPTGDVKLVADTLLDSLRQLVQADGGTLRLVAVDTNGYIVDYALPPQGELQAERAFQRVVVSKRGVFTVTFTTRDIASLSEAKRNAIVQELKELTLKQ